MDQIPYCTISRNIFNGPYNRNYKFLAQRQRCGCLVHMYHRSSSKGTTIMSSLTTNSKSTTTTRSTTTLLGAPPGGILIPGGLEVLWKEVPEGCKYMFHIQDIPDGAKSRGYFTVCELLALKRKLLYRFYNTDNGGGVEIHVERGDEELVNKELQQQNQQRQQELDHHQQQKDLQEQQQQQLQIQNQLESSMMTSPPPPPHSSAGASAPPAIPGPSTSSQYAIQYIDISPPSSGRQSQGGASSDDVMHTQTQQDHHQAQGRQDDNNNRNSMSMSMCLSTVTTVMPVTVSGNEYLFVPPPPPPPPPYRAIPLVLRLLQIGNYFFRSFSQNNPNRCRILFNTQHILCECNLPVVQPIRDTFQPLRKLLTIDIRFDQISVLSFDTDKLAFRVEGPPILTITYNPVTPGDNLISNISQQDQFLLDQIENGQLKLSPCYQLYFLNERLVQNLLAHFQDMPKFRHVIRNDKVLNQQLLQYYHQQ